jgi:hypothetical protein
LKILENFEKNFCCQSHNIVQTLEKISENLKKTFLLPFWQHFDERLKIWKNLKKIFCHFGTSLTSV